MSNKEVYDNLKEVGREIEYELAPIFQQTEPVSEQQIQEWEDYADKVITKFSDLILLATETLKGGNSIGDSKEYP